MSTFAQVIAIMFAGFVTGALARFAIPGPDPMPAWLTIAIGIVGSAIGGAIGSATTGGSALGVSFGSFFAAVLLVVAYRKLVQKRPVFGFEALRYPRRGIGVEDYRARLARAGIDPDALLDRAVERRAADDHAPADDHESPEDRDRKTGDSEEAEDPARRDD